MAHGVAPRVGHAAGGRGHDALADGDPPLSVADAGADDDGPTLGGIQDDSPFRSPAWLPGRHLQTIVPSLFAPRVRVRYERERWDTPDGDFIEVARTADQPPDAGDRPLIVVFHGLEGNAESRYVRNLLAGALARGWRGIAPQFRGCGGTLNDLPRFYHSGDSDEIDWVVRRIVAERRGHGPLYVVGVSLGGNMLLKWLGEQGPRARALVTAAAAISAPMDLAAGGHALGVGFNRVYGWMFLRTLKAKSLAKLERHAGLFDAARVKAARDLHAFDNVVTAPLHGFVDTEDYWRRASSKPLLRHVALPTLILNARNDPFLPQAALPRRDEVSSCVTLDFTAGGGHVGFVHAGRGGSHWMPRRVLAFLASHDRSMDDLVKQALAKWPDVPDCTGWLSLDARGRWRIGDAKDGPRQPITNAAMNAFINRNYFATGSHWIFQNGPQRVFVELEYTPFVWRLSPRDDGHWSLVSQTGVTADPRALWLDDAGRFLVEADPPSGAPWIGVVHDHDTALVAELLRDDDGNAIDDDVLSRLVESDTATIGEPRLRWPRTDLEEPRTMPLQRIAAHQVPSRFAFEPKPSVALKVDVDTRR